MFDRPHTSSPLVPDLISPPDLPQAKVNKCLIALVNRKIVQKDNSSVCGEASSCQRALKCSRERFFTHGAERLDGVVLRCSSVFSSPMSWPGGRDFRGWCLAGWRALFCIYHGCSAKYSFSSSSPMKGLFTLVFLLSLFQSISAFAPGFPYGSSKVRGVNLGGWLVLEVISFYRGYLSVILINSQPWVIPSLFDETGIIASSHPSSFCF